MVSQVRKVLPASCTIHQQIMRGGELVTDATVIAAFISPDGRPRRQPKEWVAIYKALEEKVRSEH